MRLKIIRGLVAFGADRLTLSSLVQHPGLLPTKLSVVLYTSSSPVAPPEDDRYHTSPHRKLDLF